MATEVAARPAAASGTDIASRRVLRLALGTSLSLWVSQAVGWEMSFLAPVFTLLLLTTPMPAPGVKQAIFLVIAVLAPVLLGSIVLLPFFTHLQIAGVLLVALLLFHAFYFSARGGPPLLGSLLTIGITLNVAIGSVNIEALYGVITGLAIGVAVGVLFVMLAHALLPDPSDGPAAGQQALQPPLEPPSPDARRRAFRALLVVMPVALWFLLSSASMSYMVVMIQVAALGQQAQAAASRSMGRSLLASTFWGGLAAVVGWQLLQIWPSLLFYTLLVALAGLLFGRRIFQGSAMRPDGSMWSYAFLTMMVLLAPAALDSINGTDAVTAFWWRLFLMALAALYGSLAMIIFDAFWRTERKRA